MLTKAEWRRRAREARAGINLEDPRHCQELARFLASTDRSPGWVVGYQAMSDEVDLRPLFSRPELGPFAVTRVPDKGYELSIHPLDSPSELHPYGFTQPVCGAPMVDDDQVAVVLVPGLAFDRRGVRLGRGKGYYDRFLARLPASSLFIGITGGYIVAELPNGPHDVTMTHLSGAFGVATTPLPEPVG
jgi:5-formyltetrahydrofolate cyclo-ligase